MFKPNCNSSAALTHAFMEVEPILRFQLSKLLSRQEDVDDILYETYTKAYDAMQTQTIHSPKDFLMRVSRNLAINEAKRYANKVEDSYDQEQISHLECPDKSIEDQFLDEEKLILLDLAIDDLPPQCQKALVLRCKNHLSYKEIAVTMGVSVKTVEKHLGNAVRRCSDAIKLLNENTLTPNDKNKSAYVSQFARTAEVSIEN